MLINNLRLQKRIFQKKLDKNELLWTYKNTKALIFPSSYEGFGIPIIEAQMNNCPVICSDIKIFHEIAGKNSAIFFNKENFIDLKNKLDIFLKYDSNVLKLIKKNGFLNSKKYSWKNSVKIISKIYLEYAKLNLIKNN